MVKIRRSEIQHKNELYIHKNYKLNFDVLFAKKKKNILKNREALKNEFELIRENFYWTTYILMEL